MLTTVVLAILVIAILVVAFVLIWKPRKPAAQSSASPNPNGKASSPDLSPDRELLEVSSGDVVALWSGEELMVESVLTCTESVSGRQASWRWVFLEGNRLLSSVGGTSTYFPESEILVQGSEGFDRLTTDAEQGGALKTFEERVRANNVGMNPVFFTYGDKTYRIQGTGVFSIGSQSPPARDVWQDISANQGDNVYFRLASDDGEQLLGIWTSHILMLKGKVLAASDVREVYRTGR